MLDLFWILLLFPLAGAALNGMAGSRLPERIVSVIGCGSVLLSFAVSVLAFVELVGLPADERVHTVTLFTWIQAGSFVSQVSFLFDPLSALMILIVTGVGFLIHVYSIGYMRGEEGYWRYFSYLNLFIFMMSVLVLADNYLLMFVGWEGVGLCSYLLIGFYYKERFAGDAAKKAFIVNRIGDFAFLLGMFLLFVEFGSIAYLEVFPAIAQQVPAPEVGFGVLSLVGLLFFIGATGKSAQIPLYVWLPDAMAGPTPVSALIHAATMVTAGVYMMARSGALYSRTPETLVIVSIVALLTALLAALIAILQNDIKKVLAYSTVSQLGYMFLACGAGAFSAGVFHLMTHAFFKALLFLGSGAVILAMHHQQDIFKMGGLRKYLPHTTAVMWVGTLAIAGFPGLSGFFSKDEILWETFIGPFHTLSYVLWGGGVLVAGLTAFYMSRMMFVTFHGPERIEMGHHHGDDDHAGHTDHSEAHGHESARPEEPGWSVRGPLFVLAGLSVVGGLVGLPAWLGTNLLHYFLEPSLAHRYVAEAHGAHNYALEIGLAAVTTLVGLLGIGAAYVAYVKSPELPAKVGQSLAGLATLMRQKFLVDEFYDAAIVRPMQWFSRNVLWKVADVLFIDGIVNGVAETMKVWAQLLRRLQSGYVRSYAVWVLVGTVLIFFYYATQP